MSIAEDKAILFSEQKVKTTGFQSVVV
ncbi:hypothetical protein CCP3SC1_380020 [Gammaproteobacteria bacterium]